MADIVVIAERQKNTLHTGVYQALGKAKAMADSIGAGVGLYLMGDGDIDDIGSLYAYGAGTVVFVRDALLKEYSTDAYAGVAAGIITKENPLAVLACSTFFSRDYLPVAAAKCGTDIIVDCMDASVSTDGRVRAVRPGLDGGIAAVVYCRRYTPQIVLFRPGVLSIPAKSQTTDGHFVQRAAQDYWQPTAPRVSLSKIIPAQAAAASLEDAELIIAGGRGLKTKENFQLLVQLAGRLGGRVACTRPCVDVGWAPPTQQVGQTGVSVRPALYLAFGISGAIQHITGLAKAKHIFAVNTDPGAHIFNMCSYGAVADAAGVARQMLHETALPV